MIEAILWFSFVVLALLPLGMYLVYRWRRLGVRREHLLQALLNLELVELYLKMRHNDTLDEWRHLGDNQKKSFLDDLLHEDFSKGFSPMDYLPPALLVTAAAGIGWFFIFASIAPHQFFDATGFVLQYVPQERLVGLAYGFIGGYLASLLALFEAYSRNSLNPNQYYSIVYRLGFSSIAALLATFALADAFKELLAFAVGLFPMEKTWTFITGRLATAFGAAQSDIFPGEELARIQGLESERQRQVLVEANVPTIQTLATADPLWLLYQTTFPLKTIIDLIDKAILYSYVGEKVPALRMHGIGGVIDLVSLVSLPEQPGAPVPGTIGAIDRDKLVADLASVLGQSADEFKALIYNLFYDPTVGLIFQLWTGYQKKSLPYELPPGRY